MPLPPDLPSHSAGDNAGYAAATAAHRAGHLAEAEAAYRAVVTADPAHADAWHMLGGLLLQSGRLPEAEATLRHALTLREEPLYLCNFAKALIA